MDSLACQQVYKMMVLLVLLGRTKKLMEGTILDWNLWLRFQQPWTEASGAHALAKWVLKSDSFHPRVYVGPLLV